MFKSAVQLKLRKKTPSLAAMGKEIRVSTPVDTKVISQQNKRPLELTHPEEPKRKFKFQKRGDDE